MIKIENVSTDGWKTAIRGMRNPLNSWERSDSYFGAPYLEDHLHYVEQHIGENDAALMRKLRKAGTDHRKFMRMITVSMDITAPLYWWKEFDTYKVGTVTNSCSTMHTIHKKAFTYADFSAENLMPSDVALPTVPLEHLNATSKESLNPKELMTGIIDMLNTARHLYLLTKDKAYWNIMIQLLPSSYNQKRTVLLNYEVLANMYASRKNHKLAEWREFCEYISVDKYHQFPMSDLITGEEIPIDASKS